MNILIDGSKHFFYNDLIIEKTLPTQNYELTYDGKYNCYLQSIPDFEIPKKIYDIDKPLRELIIDDFKECKSNMGALLTGNKGQGKSLTSKMLCREIGLPVLCITKPLPKEVDFIQFLTQITQDYVLYIDEFEKLFNKHSNNAEKELYHSQESFLSFMDGVITRRTKTLFLMTTNEEVNEYFLNRTSRIKYKKDYLEMPEELFNMIVEDKFKDLPNKDALKQDLEESISLLNINIDTLISITNDVIRLNRPFSEFAKYYNYSFEQYRYEVQEQHGGEGEFKFKGFITTKRRIKPKDTYIDGYTVLNMDKFSPEEVIFESYTYDEDDKKISVKVKLQPYKSSIKASKLVI